VKALIEQGEELPYQAATSSGATAVQFRKATLKLEVTPQITPEGNVILDGGRQQGQRRPPTPCGLRHRHQAREDAGAGGERRHRGHRRHLHADRPARVNKVPLLGDLPFVGWLFKNTERTSNKTELLVFITPKIVTDRTAAR
jgi:type IV pilus assembly protein PilQ